MSEIVRPKGGVTARGQSVTLALAAVYLLWGGTFLGNKVALESLPPLVLTASRFIAGGALILIGARLLGRRVWPGGRQFAAASLVGLFLVGGGSSLLAVGQQYVDSGLAALVISSMPLWALVLGRLMGSRPSRTALIGIGAGFVGLALLVGASITAVEVSYGVLILLVSTLLWAIGSMTAQRLDMPGDALVSSGWQMLTGGAVVALFVLARGGPGDLVDVTVTGRSALAWVALTVLSTAVGYSCYAWLLQNATLRLATTYAYVNPVVAVVLGAAVLGERLTWAQAPGALIILAAVALVVAAEQRVVEPAAAVLNVTADHGANSVAPPTEPTLGAGDALLPTVQLVDGRGGVSDHQGRTS